MAAAALWLPCTAIELLLSVSILNADVDQGMLRRFRNTQEVHLERWGHSAPVGNSP